MGIGKGASNFFLKCWDPVPWDEDMAVSLETCPSCACHYANFGHSGSNSTSAPTEIIRKNRSTLSHLLGSTHMDQVATHDFPLVVH